MLLLFYCLSGFNALLAQTDLFTYTTAPGILSASQYKVVTYFTGADRVGTLKYLNLDRDAIDDATQTITFTIDGVNSNNDIEFIVEDVFFVNPTHYIAWARSAWGTVDLYFTPDGLGGTIDLYDRLFDIFPFGGNMGLLIERNLSPTDTTICNTESALEVTDYCEDDCGSDIVDALALVTPEATAWITDNFGIFGSWWIWVEAHNINTIFQNSLLPGKGVRVTIRTYEPEFDYSDDFFQNIRVAEDINSVLESTVIDELRSDNAADVVVLITNNNYTGPRSDRPGIFETFGAATTTDPEDDTKVAIVNIFSMDRSRYTFAHEVSHFFGCLHSEVITPNCPFGKQDVSGRNTLLAFSEINLRIPNLSNPDVSFNGEATGDADTRDNAQQVRSAFCEVASITPGVYSVTFTPDAQLLCGGGGSSLTSFVPTVYPGYCTPFPAIIPELCGTSPYTYEWRMSLSADFASSTVVGTSEICELYASTGCPLFYLRLTVTSNNGKITSHTRRYLTILCCFGPEPFIDQVESDIIYASPNPASEEFTLHCPRNIVPENIECYNSNGQLVEISHKRINATDYVIQTDSFTPGVYFLRVTAPGFSQTVKVIVDR